MHDLHQAQHGGVAHVGFFAAGEFVHVLGDQVEAAVARDPAAVLRTQPLQHPAEDLAMDLERQAGTDVGEQAVQLTLVKGAASQVNGGPGSVRGFTANTLGPTTNYGGFSHLQPLGGAVKTSSTNAKMPNNIRSA